MTETDELLRPEEYTMSIMNSENIKLEKEYLTSLKECGLLNLELREAKEELQDLSNSYKALQERLHCIHLFTNEQNNELETEKSLLKLVLGEHAKTQLEIKELIKRNKEAKELQKHYENCLVKMSDKVNCREDGLEKMKERMDEWMKELEEVGQVELIFKKYHQLDRNKIREMLLGISSLSEQLHNKKLELGKQQTEGNALKFSLNKTLDELKRSQQDRKELIKRLMDLSKIIARKDQDISLMNKMTQGTQNELDGLLEQRHSKEGLLKRQTHTNNKLDTKLKHFNLLKEKLKNHFLEISENLTTLNHKYHSLRIQLDRTALDLELMRTSVNRNKQDVVDDVERLKQVAKEICRLIEEDKQMDLNDKNKHQKLNIIQQNIRRNEMMRNKVNYELRELTKIHYQKEVEAKREMAKKKMALTQIALKKATFVKIREETEKLETMKLQKMKFLFIKELNMQMMTRKIHMLEGHLLLTEQTAMISQVREKSAILEECNKSLLFWTTQARNVKGTLHRERYECDKIILRKQEVSNTLLETELQLKIANQVWSSLHEQKKELMLNESMQQMVADKLLTLKDRFMNQKISLEESRQLLLCEMTGKKMEIQANKERLRAQTQLTMAKKRELSIEIGDKKCKSAQLTKKYGVLVTFMKSSDSDAESGSPVQFIVRSIEEKEALKTKGNALSLEAKKLEEELKGLKNAVLLVKCSNAKRIGMISDTEKEKLEKVKLDEALKKVGHNMSNKRKHANEARELITKKKEKIEELVLRHQLEVGKFRVIEAKWEKLREKLEKQQCRFERTQKLLHQCLSKNKDNPAFETFKSEITLNAVEKLSEIAMKWLSEAGEKQQKFKELLLKKFEELNFRNLTKIFEASAPSTLAKKNSELLTSSRSSTSSALTPNQTPIFKSVQHAMQQASKIDSTIIEIDATTIFTNAPETS